MACVGIFFIVNDSIISDKISDELATKNELFVEHGEHYNFWLNLIPSTKTEVAFKSHSYDYYPRGRVVFDIQSYKISLFTDRCLDTTSINQIIKNFEISSEQVQVRNDEHYQCHSCNSHFLDDLEHHSESYDD